MRIVIKVGTSTLAHATGLLNIRRVEKLCEVMSDLKNAGHQLVLVSSALSAWGWASCHSAAGRRISRQSRRLPQWDSVS